MRQMSARRRKGTVLASCSAAMGGCTTILMHQHRALGIVSLAVQMAMLVWAIALLARERTLGCM